MRLESHSLVSGWYWPVLKEVNRLGPSATARARVGQSPTGAAAGGGAARRAGGGAGASGSCAGAREDAGTAASSATALAQSTRLRRVMAGRLLRGEHTSPGRFRSRRARSAQGTDHAVPEPGEEPAHPPPGPPPPPPDREA